jgi:hypothetical protein
MRESERHESPLVYGIANRNRTRTAFPELHKEKTRTAWAVFKYCGTKTVSLRIKKI